MLTAKPPQAATPQRVPFAEGAGGLELWLLNVRSASAAALDLSTLDRDERTRASRFRSDRDRVAYVAGHVSLRSLIADRVGLSPREVSFDREPCVQCGRAHGRPVLAGREPLVQFSISRRAGFVLLALARARVGVDIEELPADPTVVEVAPLLHPTERARIMDAAADARARRFASIWTRKEAYLKATGAGIGADLAADRMTALEDTRPLSRYALFDVPAPPGYAAAVALECPSAVT